MVFSSVECDICHKTVSERESREGYVKAIRTWMTPSVTAIMGRHWDALAPKDENRHDPYVCSAKCLKQHLQKIVDGISDGSLNYPPDEKTAV